MAGFGHTDTEAGESPAVYMVCGISYHRSPVEVRERIAVSPARLPDALRFVKGQRGVRECMVLSTCNRTELYISAEAWLDGRGLFAHFVQHICHWDLTPFSDQVYELRGGDAIRHLFRVASSLDSLVLGEPQILGQAKNAFRAAESQECIARDLHRWVPRAFAVAKQVRNETGICDAAVSVSYAAVQLARKIFENLAGKSVVLLGAGKMGELAALHLREAGATSIVVVNRTQVRAEEVAAKCLGVVDEFERRFERIADADVVVCSTDAPHFILDQAAVRRMLHGRSSRPLLILDISIPRNVDPAVQSLDGVYLFNVDDLDSVVQANRAGRQAEAVRAEALLQKALEKFLEEESRSHMAPAIAAIRSQVRSICMSELARLEHRRVGLSAAEKRDLELMLHRIAQKILHPAIMELKAVENRGEADAPLTLVESLFGIDRRSQPAKPRLV